MELTEHIALYLRANGYGHATAAGMPHEPDRVQTVYGTGVRPRRDADGSRFQIICRSSRGVDDALTDAMDIAALLDDFEGITSVDSPYFTRIRLDSGASALGKDDCERYSYSMNFTAWQCD